MFPSEMPRPEPNMDDAQFWLNCNQRRLMFQACGSCGTPRHPPTPMCGNCQSTVTEWAEAPEGAVVYSFTVVHYAAHPAVADNLPYVVAVVVFTDMPGVRLVTNITEIAPDKVNIDMEVRLWWDQLDQDVWVPRFRPLSRPDASGTS